MNTKEKVTSLSGHRFYLDTSDTACEEFGFKSGDVIVSKDYEFKFSGDAIISKQCGFEYVVRGVACEREWQSKNQGLKVLWIQPKKQKIVVYPQFTPIAFELKK